LELLPNFPLRTRLKDLGWDAGRELFQNYKVVRRGPETSQNIWSVYHSQKGDLSNIWREYHSQRKILPVIQ